MYHWIGTKRTQLQEEAVAGRARITEDSNSLLPALKNDPNIRPPYSVTQISDSAMHRETLYIYRHARPETRAQYDRGHYIEGGKEENWIIKWSLWHVFRYRDNRNRGRTTPSTSNVPRDHRGSLSSGHSNVSLSESIEQGSSEYFWDSYFEHEILTNIQPLRVLPPSESDKTALTHTTIRSETSTAGHDIVCSDSAMH